MNEQLLWIEACLKLGTGLALIIAPRTFARLFGLPSADQPFWPRLLGALLIGLAAASLLEVRMHGGLGLGGSIAVNLASAAMIGALLILGRAGKTLRGRFLLWVATIALVALSLVEIAYAAAPAG
ncbi:MAG: ABC transporter permease [Hyphomicrobiaceae bacterium]